MKIKLITTDPTLLKWQSLKSKTDAILAVLNTAKNANFTLDIEYRDIRPEVTSEGRIKHEWFHNFTKPFFIKEVYFVGIHFSEKQKKSWGIMAGIRGANLIDKDDMGEFYIWSDEKTKRKDRKGLQFIETFLHEMRHEICRGSNLPDDTHELHAKDKTLVEHFKCFDMAKYRPLHQAKYALLRKILVDIVKGLQRQIRPKYELPVPFTAVTQAYGVRDKMYKMTEHHIGVDLRAPLGTPVKAPCDGKLIDAGFTKSLGHYLVYDMKGAWLMMPHLTATPTCKDYLQGEVMGHIGSTGLQTGVHAHIEVWMQPHDRSKLTSSSWDYLTTDPIAWFGLK